MIAVVCGVIAASIFAGSIVIVSGSMSQNTGVAPLQLIACGVAGNVKGVVMTILTWPLSKSGQIMLATPSGDDLRELIRLYEAGRLNVTIDSTFPFAKAAEAHRRVESGVDHGKVVLIN